MNAPSKILLVALSSAFVAVGSVACKKEEPPTTTTTPKTSFAKEKNEHEDTEAIRDFLNKDKPASTASGALPPNHPPIGATSAAKTNTAGALPPGHPPMPNPPAAQANAITFTPPEGWQSQTVTSSMRKAQYVIPRASGDNADGQLIAYYFGQSQGGSVEANIDRWTGMFTTPEGKPVPAEAIKRESTEVDGMKVTTLDLSGLYVDQMSGINTAAAKEQWRMLSAIVETPQGPWFFKGVGPLATMKANEPNFQTFVNSIKKTQ